MLGDAVFVVTDWDWLKVQLRLYSLESWSAEFGVRFEFEQVADDRIVTCLIYAQHTQVMIDEGVSKQEQMSYYEDWVAGQRDQIRLVLERLPGIDDAVVEGTSFIFLIVYDYGMGASSVCKFRGDQVEWTGVADGSR